MHSATINPAIPRDQHPVQENIRKGATGFCDQGTGMACSPVQPIYALRIKFSANGIT
jgi:hypothetical protein